MLLNQLIILFCLMLSYAGAAGAQALAFPTTEGVGKYTTGGGDKGINDSQEFVGGWPQLVKSDKPLAFR